MKPAKILFFIEGPAPTPEDFEAASKIQANVVFRNALAVPAEPHAMESCDGVAGAVPEIYAEKFKKADEAVEKKKAAIKEITEKAGDEPAPKKQGKAAAAWSPNESDKPE